MDIAGIINRLSMKALLELRVAINNRVAVLHADAADRLADGEMTPGFTLEHGKSKRTIVDQDAFEAALVKHLGKDVVYTTTTSPLTMTAAEKALKKAIGKELTESLMTKHTKKVKGNPTLVYTGEDDEIK